jgi:hypothetical protein
MVADRDGTLISGAVELLEQAAQHAVSGWMAAQRLGETRCTANLAVDGQPEASATVSVGSVVQTAGEDKTAESEVVIVSDSGSPAIHAVSYTERRTFVASLRSVEMSGKDGVITAPRRTGPCTVYTDSSFPFLDVGMNLEMLSLWSAGQNEPTWYNPGGRPGSRAEMPLPSRHDQVASIVSFAGLSFYHFVHEVLPRLLLLRPLLAERPDLKVLTCRDTTSNKFPSQFLALIPGLDGKSLSHRFVDSEGRGRPGPRARPKTLLYPGWDPVRSSHVPHCLAPHSLVRELRGVLAPQAVAVDAPRRSQVIFVSRAGMRMRQLEDEAGLIDRITAALPEGYSLEVFRGDASAANALNLFSSAAAVIGVHGGALSNIVACAEGKSHGACVSYRASRQVLPFL